MRITRSAGIVAAVLCLALWGTSVATAGTTLSTNLVGAEERPGPGDPDGFGFITLSMNQGRGEVCFELTFSGIETPFAGHIHKAPAGQFGDVFVTLFTGSNLSTTCVSATKAQIKEIRHNPEQFYVNLHTASFPNGAIRGQLGD